MSLNVLQRLIIAALHRMDIQIPDPWADGSAMKTLKQDAMKDLPNIGNLYRDQKGLITQFFHTNINNDRGENEATLKPASKNHRTKPPLRATHHPQQGHGTHNTDIATFTTSTCSTRAPTPDTSRTTGTTFGTVYDAAGLAVLGCASSPSPPSPLPPLCSFSLSSPLLASLCSPPSSPSLPSLLPSLLLPSPSSFSSSFLACRSLSYRSFLLSVSRITWLYSLDS